MEHFDLQRFRTDRNLTQQDLATLLGCKQPFISAVEKGERELSDDKILILQEKYGDITGYISTIPEVVQNNQNGDNISGRTVKLASGTDKFLEVILEQSKQITKGQEHLTKAQEQIDRLIKLFEQQNK